MHLGVINYADVTASSSYGTDDVTDRSDDGIDNDGNTENDPTVVTLVADASIMATKSATVFDGMGMELPVRGIQLIM